MIQLHQQSYNALLADRERLQAILDGRVSVERRVTEERDGPAVRALAHGGREVMHSDGRTAIDSALRVVRHG